MKAKQVVGLVGVGLSVLVGCGGSSENTWTGSGAATVGSAPAPASSATPSGPSTVDCVGTRNQMQDRDVVSLDINNANKPACSIPINIMGANDIKQYCYGDDFCTFSGHILRQDKNLYTIDKIVGPPSTVDCTGTRNQMQDHDVVSLDVNDDKLPACFIPISVWGANNLLQFCTDDGKCAFRGHVSSQDGSLYTIDKITGPILE
jgi:hypothetical protein